MTEQEKQTECERICGKNGKRGVHKIAPEMCPVKADQWLGHKPKDKSYDEDE